MKSLKTILGVALSIGGLGTAATVTGVSIAQADRAVVDSQVEAANTACDVYFKATWPNETTTIGEAKVHYWNGGDYWMSMTEVFKDGGTPVYKYTIPSGNSEFQYQIKIKWGSGDWQWKTSVNKTVTNNILCTPIGQGGWDGSNFTLTQGTAYPYTINYNGNGNTSGSMTSDSAYGNVQWGLKANAFAKTNYLFNGWNTAANGSGTSYSDKALLPTKSNTNALNLYAQWKEMDDPSASTNSFYVYDPHTILGSTFANINVYGFDQASTIKPMSWPGTHDGVSQVTLGRTSMYQVDLSTSYPSFLMNCGDQQNQTVDVTNLSSNIGKVLVIDNSQTNGKYNVHWDNSEIYSDVPATDGYYLLGNDAFVTATGGSGTSWKYATGVKMNTLSGTGNKASYVLTVNQTVEFRARSYLNSTDLWLNFGKTYDGTDGITTDGNNVQLLSGTYTIYVNSSSEVYVAKGIPLDAFCTTFLEDIEDVCDAVTGNTDPDDLSALWTTLSNLYDNVLSSEKPTIVAIGFNGGSDIDDPHKVVKAYHYIVTKYGTTLCPDFIWGGSYSPSSANKVSANSVANNSVSAIIIVTSVVTLTAVGAFFFLRKKRYN